MDRNNFFADKSEQQMPVQQQTVNAVAPPPTPMPAQAAVPVVHKSKSSKKLLLMIGGLLVSAILLGGGLLIGSKMSKSSSTSTAPTPSVKPTVANTKATPTESPTTSVAVDNCGTVPADYTCYQDQEDKIKFAYPKEWGEVKRLVSNDTKINEGRAVRYTFTANPRPKLGAKSTDYKVVLGRDYDCSNATLGFAKTDDASFGPVGESKLVSDDYIYTKSLKDATDLKMAWRFETFSSGVGSCPSLSVFGFKFFKEANSLKYLGAQLFWSRYDYSNYKPVTKAEYDAYVANPSAALSDADIEVLSTFLNSVQPL
jgi:hypothetical protein